MDFSKRFVEQLGREYRTRRERNPAYSLRSYGRDLEVNSGRLSQYFSGRRPVTRKSALRIMGHLGLSPTEQARWLGVAIEPSRAAEPHLLEQRAFELISEPIHFTILSLVDTRGFKNNPQWIARRIRSSVPEVAQSLALLKDLGLLEERKSGLALTHKEGVRSSDGVRNAALRRAHEKQLRQAIESLESIPLNLRDVTSITMTADLRRLNEAKVLIQDFRRKLCKLLEGSDATEVYRLQVQLIPLTEINGEVNHEG